MDDGAQMDRELIPAGDQHVSVPLYVSRRLWITAVLYVACGFWPSRDTANGAASSSHLPHRPGMHRQDRPRQRLARELALSTSRNSAGIRRGARQCAERGGRRADRARTDGQRRRRARCERVVSTPIWSPRSSMPATTTGHVRRGLPTKPNAAAPISPLMDTDIPWQSAPPATAGTIPAKTSSSLPLRARRARGELGHHQRYGEERWEAMRSAIARLASSRS